MRAAAKSVRIVSGTPAVTKGTAGLGTQLAGQPATVSGIALATDGIGPGHLIEAASR